MLEQSAVFVAGQDSYHTYRIPALIMSPTGTLFAFCEGRRHGRGDAGEIHLLLKRSFDQGRTWQPVQHIITDAGFTNGNPCPVIDQRTGTIWLPFTRNPAEGTEAMVIAGQAARTIWLTCSIDDGESWATPYEITSTAMRPEWTWYATGPGHGIQLRSGRLIIPCDHRVGKTFTVDDPMHSHIIYSDDPQQGWRIGGIVDAGTNECGVVETEDGGVYINCRNYRGARRRATARSYDGGESFGSFGWDETLIEPVCQASLVRYSTAAQERSRILFANPASTRRENMTVRLSYDECHSWSHHNILHSGPAAYSDLAVGADGTIYCLYEYGIEQPYEQLRLARFDLDWLTQGAEHA